MILRFVDYIITTWRFFNDNFFLKQISRLALKLILPLHNTIRQHLEDPDTEGTFKYIIVHIIVLINLISEYDGNDSRNNNNGPQFLYFDTLSLQGICHLSIRMFSH